MRKNIRQNIMNQMTFYFEISLVRIPLWSQDITSCKKKYSFFFSTYKEKKNFITMPVIQLVSSDGEKFPVELDIIKQSVTIKTMLEDLGIDDDSNSEPVPLPNVEASILGKIIEWCNKHKDDARDKFTEISLSKLPEWYVEKKILKINELLISQFFWISFFI